MLRFTPVALVLAVAALAASQVAWAATPAPTLTGETLAAVNTFSGAVSATASCNADGSGTISYIASGVSSSPYPGTFTESGTATLGPLGSGLGGYSAVTAFQATFTITSPLGDVNGTKALGTPFNPTGACVAGSVVSTEPAFFFVGGASYDAVIQSATGTFHDFGTTNVGVALAHPTTLDQISETFVSALPATIPLAPGNSPAEQQGKGCGDKNHIHLEDNCKK